MPHVVTVIAVLKMVTWLALDVLAIVMAVDAFKTSRHHSQRKGEITT